MATFLVYETATGVARSVGTVVATPLPAGLTAVELATQDAAGLLDGTRRWDAPTRTVVATNLASLLVNQATIIAEVTAARATNNAALDRLTTALTSVSTALANTATIKGTAGGNTTAVNGKVNALCDELTRTLNVLAGVNGAITQLGEVSKQLNKVGRLILGEFDATT